MKLYKSFVAFSLMAMAMMGCSTEDLENDINALKDQVAKVEAQVQKLNDNMNVLRIALDGNKTIQELTENGDGSYTLLLSDGSTLDLTQGVAGSVYYPQVSIDGDGYWVIDGVKQDVKAKAEKGQDGITPKFQLKAEGGNQYWQVSYDNGKTYEFLLVDGKKVQANATESIKPTENGPISEVKADENSFSFKFDGKTYTIPVVKGLKVIVKIDESQMENGYWIVPKGNTTQVDVDWGEAEYVLLSATEGWKAEKVKGASAIKVTAPAEAGAEGVITIQVNKGTYWAVEKVKVRAKFVATSNKEKYDAGLELKIGNVVVKKVDDTHVSIDGVNYELSVQVIDKNTEITTVNGVYFVNKGVTLTYNAAEDVSNHTLVVIGNDLKEKSTFVNKSQIKLIKGEMAGNMLMMNLKSDFSQLDNYPFAQNGDNVWKNLVLDNCEVMTKMKRPLTFISSSKRSIENIVICNSEIVYEKVVDTYMLVNINGSTADNYNLKFVNNVVYCKAGMMGKYKLFNSGTKAGGMQKTEISNNLFINILPHTEGFVRSTMKTLNFENNVIWFDAKTTSNNEVIFRNSIDGGKFAEKGLTGILKHNLAKKDSDAGKHYQNFFSGVDALEGAENVTVIETSPFATYNVATGEFVLKAEYKTYGPQN